MAKLYALYNTPTDPDAFDRYYFSTHVPLAKKIPGLRSYEVTSGKIGSPGGASPYHMVAALSFDSMQALQAGLNSPEGAATAADLGNFATGGVTLLMSDTRVV